MPASYLAGKNAAVSTDAGVTLLGFREWKCAMKCAALKINDFLSQGYQNLLAGFISATITLSGAYHSGGTALTVSNTYTFDLEFSATLSLSVPAMLTELTPTVNAEKEIVLDATAESNGLFTAAVT